MLALLVGFVGTGAADSPRVLIDCTGANLARLIGEGGEIELQCSHANPPAPTKISFPATIVVGPGTEASVFPAPGQRITLDGEAKRRLFKLEGGTLTLTDLTLADGYVGGSGAGAPGGTPHGGRGEDGKNGENVGPGAPGNDGGDGTNGADGDSAGPSGRGEDAAGGAIFIGPASTMVMEGDIVVDNRAIAGDGGHGADGGRGGSGGDGGAGSAGGRASGPGSTGAVGGDGGDAGDAGDGGAGGLGGPGGNAYGGAIYNEGSLRIESCVFAENNLAEGGAGGRGGVGGPPGIAGIGGAAGAGGAATGEGAHGGAAGNPGVAGGPGKGGAGGEGGPGGEASGGAIFNAAAGTLTITGATSFIGDEAHGGSGGSGGAGANGGDGPPGGEGGRGGNATNGGGETATMAGAGSDGLVGGAGLAGAPGGDGGAGGVAKGGAIASEAGGLTIEGPTVFEADAAIGGGAGKGGKGGHGGHGGSGGWGGQAGEAQCGSVGGSCATPAGGGPGGDAGGGGDGGDGGEGGDGATQGAEAFADDVWTPSSLEGGTQGSGALAGNGGQGGQPGPGGTGGQGEPPGTSGETGVAGTPGPRGSGFVIPAPILTAITPASPGNATNIAVQGTAPAGTMVQIYDNATCGGSPLGESYAGVLAAQGVPTRVPANATTTLYAHATKEDASSACSTQGLVYEEDSRSPATTITAGPAEGATIDEAPTFEFTSSEAGSQFECRIDDGSWVACLSPYTAAALATPGSHRFEVIAVDRAGNSDLTSAVRSYTVVTRAGRPPAGSSSGGGGASGPSDQVAARLPKPTLSDHPRSRVAATGPKTKVRFAFGTGEPGADFRCRIDGGRFGHCTSPQVFRLQPGRHTFSVQEVGAGGVGGPVRVFKFKVLPEKR